VRSREFVSAQLHWLRRKPQAYLAVWGQAIRGNLRSPRFLLRSIVVVPKAAVFARRMEELEIRHIHAHFATHPTLAAWAASRLTGIPYSFTVHAHDLYVNRTMLGAKVRGARFVATVSDYNQRLIGQFYGTAALAKTVIVRCGVGASWLAADPGPAVQGGDITLACVASLEPYKGHRYLLDALALLDARGYPFRCILVGDGPLHSAITKQVHELGLSERVHLVGALDQTLTQEIVRSANVVVLPSIITGKGKMEGVPVALMEALAARVPVVATDISGVGELIEDGLTGLLVRERDPEAMARALGRLASEPMLGEQLAEAGRTRVAETFSLEKNVRILAGLFEAGAPGAI
jgi:glycosyltransferase involved in cell wall biosynthesis